jgi:S1-C subfamily serine protease
MRIILTLRTFLFFVFSLSIFNNAIAQATSDMLENALGGVVTIAVFETDLAKKSLGFRGDPSEMAYAKMLDLSGASGSGSGFIIKQNNRTLVITNAHVIEQASDKDGSIYIYSINRSKYKGRVIGGDSFYDLAVLEFVDAPGKEITSLSLRNSQARVGEQVFAIGNPLGEYPYSVSEGIVSAKNRVRGGLTGKFGFLQTTATVIWGNSGGPLIDGKGNVVGINSQIAFAQMGETPIWQPQINFALEAGIAQRLITDILNNDGVVSRSFLGIELRQNKVPYNPGTREYAYYSKQYPPDEFVIINKVLDDAPSAALKQYIGYQVVSINGEDTRNLEEALGELEKTKPGQKIVFNLKQNTKQVSVTVSSSALSRTGSAALGKLFLQLADAAFTQQENYMTLNFQGDGQKAKAMEFVAAKNQGGDDELLKGEWQVLGIGLYMEGNESLWRISNIADVGTAARLTGSLGYIDIALFKNGADAEQSENYKIKRVMISGNNNILQQTLWY